MWIWIDTEFGHDGDFVDMDLISIALVTEDGHEFYGERDDFDPALVTPWIRSNVMPLLRTPGVLVTSREGLRDAVNAWLDQFKDSQPVICYDHMADWSLLWDLQDKVTPPWLGSRNIRDRLDSTARDAYFELSRYPQHHALFDARANAYAMGYQVDRITGSHR